MLIEHSNVRKRQRTESAKKRQVLWVGTERFTTGIDERDIGAALQAQLIRIKEEMDQEG